MLKLKQATIFQADVFAYLIIRRLKRGVTSPLTTETLSFGGGLQHVFITTAEQFGGRVETAVANYGSALEESMSRTTFKNSTVAKGFVLYFRENLMSPYDEKIGLEIKI